MTTLSTHPARRLVVGGLFLILAACATPGGQGGYGGPGGYPEDRGGYGDPGGAPAYESTLTGTVDGIDPRNGWLGLVLDDPRSGRARRVEARYDRRTRLWYQGREHAVEGLERGDVVRVSGIESGREFLATSIEVIHDVREDSRGRDYGRGYGRDDGDDGYRRDDGYGRGPAYGSDAYGSGLRGTVTWVNPRAGLLRLEGDGYGRASGSGVDVAFDSHTTVEYQGRRYRPDELERGDRVRIEARRVGGDRWLAERIVVERSVR